MQPSPVTTSYPVTPLSATASQGQYQFPNAQTRSSGLNQPYALQIPPQNNYSHSSDRPSADAYGDTSASIYDRRFPSYNTSSFTPTHDNSHSQLHAQSPTSSISMNPQRGNTNIQPPITYAHKRSTTEPHSQALRSLLLNQVPPISHFQQQQQSSPGSGAPRGPSPPGMNDTIGHLRAAEFDLDPRGGRLPSLPS